MLARTARGLFRTLAGITAQCSVKTWGAYLRCSPRFKVTNCDLRASTSFASSKGSLNMKSSGKRSSFLRPQTAALNSASIIEAGESRESHSARPGLLYDLAAAISANGGNIEVVLIDTQAHEAIDVFYVTTDGGKLTAEKQAAIRVAVEKAAGVAGRKVSGVRQTISRGTYKIE